MKKSFLIFASIAMLSVGVMASCGGENTSNSNNQTSTTVSETSSVDENLSMVQAALNGLSVQTTVTTDFTLTTSGAGGVTISWVSDNTNVISITGASATVSRPKFEDGDATVKLTATATKDTTSLTKDFTVTVTKLDEVTTGDYIYIDEARKSAMGTVVTVRGVVSAFVGGVNNNAYSANGFYISDSTGTMYVYGYQTANTVNRSDEILLQATVGEHNGNLQLTFPTVQQTLNTGVDVPDPSAYAITGKTINDVRNPATAGNEALSGNTYVFEGYITKNTGATYTNYRVADNADGTNYMNIYSSATDLHCPENEWLDSYVTAGAKIRFAYYMNSKNSGGTSWRGNVIYIFD